jgi:hypothetical protein
MKIRFWSLEDVVMVWVDGSLVGYFDLDVIGDRVVVVDSVIVG